MGRACGMTYHVNAPRISAIFGNIGARPGDGGTHVLGTIFGTGTAGSRYRGVATGVGSSNSTRVRAAKIWRNTGTNSSSWMNDAIDYMDNNST